MPGPYVELMLLLREQAQLTSVYNLLSWDQETGMPPRTAGPRAEQLSLVARLAHESGTSPRIGELLDLCDQDFDTGDDERNQRRQANLREIRRDYEKGLKLPPSLVAEISETSSRAMEVWKVAREQADFDTFAPLLEKQLELTRKKAELLGTPKGGEAYDALLDEYEPGMTAVDVEAMFAPLRRELAPLISAISESGHAPDQTANEIPFPLDAQQVFNARVSERLGFSFDAGRFAVSVHPFSTGIAPFDTGITTRYSETQFAEALGSTMHEVGHGLYEQGLPKDKYWGQPLSESLGLGIHESQSRLWENHVGRSLPFWRWCLPFARETLGSALDGLTADDVHRTINTVRPHPIRVESDEATYNLHIMIRFDLERAMFRGELAVADLPDAWNARMESDLGLMVENDTQGCLQDIHWSMGSIGYFPTYTLGTLYAAQFWETLCEQLDDVDGSMERGEFDGILDWLRRHIHGLGRRTPSAQLCHDLTGKPLGHGPLMRHLTHKYGEIYGLGDDFSS
ncbi:MAG: carboxypeptidase M32 [Acidobacteriota bacterium]|nr:carboxypeptidase M32 [Acidobacteriota bacterium]MDH3784098.1 carboxypeptidase M32 [Acidobacteriota bacterium]